MKVSYFFSCYIPQYLPQGYELSLTISGHANSEALFKAAVLAPVSVHAHDETLFVLDTHLVMDILLNAPSEKALEEA